MISLLNVTSPIIHVIPSTGSKTQNVLTIDLIGKTNILAKVFNGFKRIPRRLAYTHILQVYLMKWFYYRMFTFFVNVSNQVFACCQIGFVSCLF